MKHKVIAILPIGRFFTRRLLFLALGGAPLRASQESSLLRTGRVTLQGSRESSQLAGRGKNLYGKRRNPRNWRDGNF